MNPATDASWEDELCAGTPPFGTVVLGDSASAHFHIPPAYLDATKIDNSTYATIEAVVANEFDWPMLSATSAFYDSAAPFEVESPNIITPNHLPRARAPIRSRPLSLTARCADGSAGLTPAPLHMTRPCMTHPCPPAVAFIDALPCPGGHAHVPAPKPYISGPVNSSYGIIRSRNRCAHRDYQNIAVNGARSGAMNSTIQQGAMTSTCELIAVEFRFPRRCILQ